MNDTEHMFSVEMRSKSYVKNIALSDGPYESVLFEGNLGKIKSLSIVEGDILEFDGFNGVLRINLTEDQLQNTLNQYRKSNQDNVGEVTK